MLDHWKFANYQQKLIFILYDYFNEHLLQVACQ